MEHSQITKLCDADSNISDGKSNKFEFVESSLLLRA